LKQNPPLFKKAKKLIIAIIAADGTEAEQWQSLFPI